VPKFKSVSVFSFTFRDRGFDHPLFTVLTTGGLVRSIYARGQRYPIDLPWTPWTPDVYSCPAQDPPNFPGSITLKHHIMNVFNSPLTNGTLTRTANVSIRQFLCDLIVHTAQWHHLLEILNWDVQITGHPFFCRLLHGYGVCATAYAPFICNAF
jgi:hypothetical protein